MPGIGAQGPQGFQGSQGAAGAQSLGAQTIVRTATTSGANAVTSVACVASHPYAVGGGASLSSGGGNGELAATNPTGGSTSSPATGWQARIIAGNTSSVLTVYVICSQ